MDYYVNREIGRRGLRDTDEKGKSGTAPIRGFLAEVAMKTSVFAPSATAPPILRAGEIIEYVSLGAGNTGRAFDLETNQRVAEFKFIRWQGGPESIRQNSLFKDFYEMAENDTKKEKYLYVLGTEHGHKFFNGGRAIASVLSRNVKLRNRFNDKFGDQYRTVRDYYLPRKGLVVIQDVSSFVPELVAAAVEAAETEEE